MVGYVFPHGNYHQPDLGWLLYSIHAAAHTLWHQDFVSIWRPGYLLNVPFVRLGFDYAALKLLYVSCLALAFIWFVWSIDRRAFKTVALPISVLLIWTIYTCYFRYIFNYYSNVPFFLMLGFAAFNSAEGRFRVLFLILSGFFFSQLVFANLALFPGVLFGLILLSFRYFCFSTSFRSLIEGVREKQHDEQNAVSLISAFLICFVITMLLYLFPGHAWAIFKAHQGASHIRHDLTEKLVFALCLFIVIAVAFLPFAFKYYLKKLGLWRGTLLFWMAGCFLIFTLLPFLAFYLEGRESIKLTMVTIAAAFGGIGAALAYLKYQLPNLVWRKALAIIIFIALLWLNNRVCSTGTYVSWLYLPLILIVLVLCFEGYVKSRLRYLIYLIFLVLLSFQPYVRIAFLNYHTFISVNQYPSQLGVLTDKGSKHLEQNLASAYAQSNCADKPFLTYFNTPSIYFLVNRIAPFGQSWVTSYAMIPYSRQLSTAHIQNWLKQPHWCVVWQDTPRRRLGSVYFDSATQLMKQLASKKVLLGDMEKKVWLYVR